MLLAGESSIGIGSVSSPLVRDRVASVVGNVLAVDEEDPNDNIWDSVDLSESRGNEKIVNLSPFYEEHQSGEVSVIEDVRFLFTITLQEVFGLRTKVVIELLGNLEVSGV